MQLVHVHSVFYEPGARLTDRERDELADGIVDGNIDAHQLTVVSFPRPVPCGFRPTALEEDARMLGVDSWSQIEGFGERVGQIARSLRQIECRQRRLFEEETPSSVNFLVAVLPEADEHGNLHYRFAGLVRNVEGHDLPLPQVDSSSSDRSPASPSRSLEW